MRFLIPALSFALGASGAALVPRQSGCCFQINVGGGPGTGPLGQLTDGQNRVGTGYSAATYCINNGVITDSAGRGCILTPPTTQFQCDAGAAGTPGFTIGAGGAISYNGNTQFYECLVAPGIWNIYTTPGGTQCSPITLTTAGGTCAAATSPPVTPPPTPTPTPAPAPTVTVTAPGYSTTATITGQCLRITATVTAPGSTVSVTSTIIASCTPSVVTSSTVKTLTVVASCTPSVVTQITTSTAPGTTLTVVASCTPSVVTQTTTSTAPGLTVVASCTPSVVTQITTVQGPGSTVTTTAFTGTTTTLTVVASCTPSVVTQTTTVQGPGSTVTTTALGSVVTVTQSAPGTTVTVPGPGTTTTVTATVPATAPSTVTSLTTIPVTITETATPSPSASTCPTNIPNTNFQFPHLINPVSSASPNTAFGTSYNGVVNRTTSTIFNFDIPASYQGTTCTLIFLLPTANTLQTSSYTLSGSGGIDVLQLSGPATAGTTYNNQPSAAKDLGAFPVTAGSSTIVATGACAAGQTVAYELKATGSLALNYFQDYNAPAIGLYITEC